MTRKKRLPAARWVLGCLALVLVASCMTAMAQTGTQTKESFNSEIHAAAEQALYFVAYDKITGQPFAVIASPGTEVIIDGTKEKLAKDFIDVLKRLEEHAGKPQEVEASCDMSYYVHGSPGCRIKQLANGGYKVVCN